MDTLSPRLRQAETRWAAKQIASDFTEDMKRLIRWYFGPADSAKAIEYAYVLSGLNPLAFGRLTPDAIGLFQLTADDVGFDEDCAALLHSPIRNVAAAYRLFTARGWRFWDERLASPHSLSGRIRSEE